MWGPKQEKHLLKVISFCMLSYGYYFLCTNATEPKHSVKYKLVSANFAMAVSVTATYSLVTSSAIGRICSQDNKYHKPVLFMCKTCIPKI